MNNHPTYPCLAKFQKFVELKDYRPRTKETYFHCVCKLAEQVQCAPGTHSQETLCEYKLLLRQHNPKVFEGGTEVRRWFCHPDSPDADCPQLRPEVLRRRHSDGDDQRVRGSLRACLDFFAIDQEFPNTLLDLKPRKSEVMLKRGRVAQMSVAGAAALSRNHAVEISDTPHLNPLPQGERKQTAARKRVAVQ